MMQGRVETLKTLAMEGSIEKVTLERRYEGGEGVGHADI